MPVVLCADNPSRTVNPNFWCGGFECGQDNFNHHLCVQRRTPAGQDKHPTHPNIGAAANLLVLLFVAPLEKRWRRKMESTECPPPA
jgi:hypothetical protein